MSYATKEQLAELAAYMASQINVPTIGVGGGFAPIGTIISYMGTVAPQDYLACDGSTENIVDYPQLADFFEAQFGSKNYFGGDGVTTFAVPNLQGEFLRGMGTNSHTNQGSGANVGEHQDGTEIPYVAKNPATATTDIFAAASNLLKKADYITSVDAPTGLHRGLISARTSDSYGQIYKSRPTNTSVLYCIKAVVAGDVYSTDERVVGTWIDGKKLYQKVVNLTMPSVAKTWKNVQALSTSDNIVFAEFMLSEGGTRLINIPNSSAGPVLSIYNAAYVSSAWSNVLGSIALYTETNLYLNRDIMFILRYTKTTD